MFCNDRYMGAVTVIKRSCAYVKKYFRGTYVIYFYDSKDDISLEHQAG